MRKKTSTPLIAPEEIRGIYAQGEEAVVAVVIELSERIETLGKQVKELEDRLAKNSRNSSKPPSSDGFNKKTKSLRRKSHKKTGGQPKHPGHTLEWSNTVEQVERHQVSRCSGCGISLELEPVQEILSRQVLDIPAIELKVREHQAEVKICPECGDETQGSFPPEASNLVQYGPRLRAMMVYLMDGQLLPSARTVELFKELFGVEISEGTFYNIREQCFEQLERLNESIQDALLTSPVVHFDETGMRVNGALWWLHVAATNGLTYYFVHPKRGQAAMDEMDILPSFSGKAIHDGWKSYSRYECEHFLCNAHHLRELQFMLERDEQLWSFQMSLLLVTIHCQVQTAKENGLQALPSEQLKDFDERYQTILAQGLEVNPPSRLPPDGPKKRGRVKQTPAHNLLQRLHKQKAAVLGFMYDFSVPFDNNQAERDIRMMKLKQKISGSFRSIKGAKMFCRIRGYFSSIRKQGHNVFDALISLFSGNAQPLLVKPE